VKNRDLRKSLEAKANGKRTVEWCYQHDRYRAWLFFVTLHASLQVCPSHFAPPAWGIIFSASQRPRQWEEAQWQSATLSCCPDCIRNAPRWNSSHALTLAGANRRDHPSAVRWAGSEQSSRATFLIYSLTNFRPCLKNSRLSVGANRPSVSLLPWLGLPPLTIRR